MSGYALGENSMDDWSFEFYRLSFGFRLSGGSAILMMSHSLAAIAVL
jgi:hypothetical protein